MKVLKNYLFNSAFQIFQIFLPLITAPYVSRVLGPTGVGDYAFSNSVVVYFGILGVLGLTQYGNRMIAFYMDEFEKRSQLFWDVFIVRAISVSVALLIYLGVLMLLPRGQRILFLIQAVYLFSVVFDISWFFNGIENFKITVTRSFIIRILSVVSVFVFVKSNDDLWLYALIMVGGTTLGNLTLWPFLKGLIRPPMIKFGRLLTVLKQSMVYFLPGIASSVYLVLNKVMIGVLDSNVAAGYFQQSDQIVRLALSLVTAMNAVLLPRVANEFKNKNFELIEKYIHKSVSLTLFISLPVMFALFELGKVFAPVYFGPGFSEVGNLMAIEGTMVVFIGLNSVVGWQYMMPIGMVTQMSTSVSVGAVVNFVLNVVLIPFFRARGAALSSVLSELVILVIMVAYTKNKLNFANVFNGMWKYVLAAIVMYLTLLVLHAFIPSNVVFLFVGILLGFIVYMMMLVLFKASIVFDFLKMIHFFKF